MNARGLLLPFREARISISPEEGQLDLVPIAMPNEDGNTILQERLGAAPVDVTFPLTEPGSPRGARGDVRGEVWRWLIVFSVVALFLDSCSADLVPSVQSATSNGKSLLVASGSFPGQGARCWYFGPNDGGAFDACLVLGSQNPGCTVARMTGTAFRD